MAGRAPIPRGMQHAIRAADCEMPAIITFSTPEAAARETRQSSISYSPLTKFIRTQLSYHRKSRRAVLLRPRGLPQAARSTRGICPDLHGGESSRHLQQITHYPRHAPMAGPCSRTAVVVVRPGWRKFSRRSYHPASYLFFMPIWYGFLPHLLFQTLRFFLPSLIDR